MWQANIGIRLHDTRTGSLHERALYAKEQGFSCAHLALSKCLDASFMCPEVMTPGLAARVKNDLDGLDCAVLGCYLNLCHPDRDAYAQTLKKYIAHLKLCRWMNAGCVGTETGNPNREYRYDVELSHTEQALELFIRRLEPVVRAAEKLGAAICIEPVYTHIVCDPKRARRVLDAIASPNLGIIFDPVNLLHPDNIARRDEIFAEAMELLEEEIQIIHLKDYRMVDGAIKSCAAGLGEMDYAAILRFAAEKKPGIQMTLEDTKPENAEDARLFIAGVYNSVSLSPKQP